MIRVGKNNLGTNILDLLTRQSLHRRIGPNRHKDRGFDLSMRRVKDSGACWTVGGEDFECEGGVDVGEERQ